MGTTAIRKCFSARAGSRIPALFDLRDEAVAEARKGLNVPRVLSLIIQGKAYLPNAEVQTLLEIDKCILAPYGEPNLFARDQRAAMVQQKCKDPRRLLLNARRGAVLVELKRLLVELEFPKSNERHSGERRATEASRHYSKWLFSIIFCDCWICDGWPNHTQLQITLNAWPNRLLWQRSTTMKHRSRARSTVYDPLGS